MVKPLIKNYALKNLSPDTFGFHRPNINIEDSKKILEEGLKKTIYEIKDAEKAGNIERLVKTRFFRDNRHACLAWQFWGPVPVNN